jgi:hypothetical protein
MVSQSTVDQEETSLTLTQFLAPSVLILRVHQARQQQPEIVNLGLHNVLLTSSITTELILLLQSRKWKKICMFWCWGNGISIVARTAVDVAESLEFCGFTSMFGCPYTCMFYQGLIPQLLLTSSSSNTLRRLQLRDCQLSSREAIMVSTSINGDVVTMGEALAMNTSLQELEFVHCRCSEHAAFVDLLHGIETHQSLSALTVRDCQLSDHQVGDLTKAVSRSATIQSFSFSINNIGSDGVSAIASWISSNPPRIRSISLRLDPLTLDLSPIAIAISNNTVLESVFLFGLTNERVSQIQPILALRKKSHSRLADIGLFGGSNMDCWLDRQSLSTLLAAIQSNIAIQRVAVSIDTCRSELVDQRQEILYETMLNQSGMKQLIQNCEDDNQSHASTFSPALWPHLLEQVAKMPIRSYHCSNDDSCISFQTDRNAPKLALYFLLREGPFLYVPRG